MGKIGQFRAMGEMFTVLRTEYLNGRVCIQLVSGGPFATLSVNLPHEPNPPEGHFWAKTWTENGPLREPALASGLFEDTGRRCPTGFVMAELWRLTDGSARERAA